MGELLQGLKPHLKQFKGMSLLGFEPRYEGYFIFEDPEAFHTIQAMLQAHINKDSLILIKGFHIE